MRLRQRSHGAYVSLFEEKCSNEGSVVSVEEFQMQSFNEKVAKNQNGKVSRFLRSIFLYLPGVFVLHMFTALLTWVAIADSRMLNRAQWQYISLFFAGSIAFTALGLGDLRKPKHFIVPFSVISVGFVTGLIGVLIKSGPPPIGLEVFFAYLLPVAYIAPLFAKTWVDRRENLSS